MKRVLLILAGLCVVALPVFAQAGNDQPDDANVKAIPKKEAADTARKLIATTEPVLSTDVSGLDSLGITTDTAFTTRDGGTRKITLERSVFHREEPFVYDDANRRDPFRALIIDEKKEGEVQTDLLRMDGACLSGVVWSQGNYLAMVRDQDGKTFFLRESDPIFQGKVLVVTQSQAIFELSEFGDYQRITLKVVPWAEKKGKG